MSRGEAGASVAAVTRSWLWRQLPESWQRRLGSGAFRRLLRFAPAAVLALVASQATYFILVNVVHTTGRVAGFVAWFAGAVVSYIASRWAFESRGRPQLVRETLPFVVISVCVIAFLTEVSHLSYKEAHALGWHGVRFSVFVQGVYFAANVATFLVRFVLFHYLVFARPTSASEPSGSS